MFKVFIFVMCLNTWVAAFGQSLDLTQLAPQVSALKQKKTWTFDDQEKAISLLSEFFSLETRALSELSKAERKKTGGRLIAKAMIPVAGMLVIYQGVHASDFERVLGHLLQNILTDTRIQDFKSAAEDLIVTHARNGDYVFRDIAYHAGIVRYELHQYLELKSGAAGGYAFSEGFEGKAILYQNKTDAAFVQNAVDYLFKGKNDSDLPQGYRALFDEKVDAKKAAKTLVQKQPFRPDAELVRASGFQDLIWNRYAKQASKAATTHGMFVETNLFREAFENISLQTLTRWKLWGGGLLMLGGAIFLLMSTEQESSYLELMYDLNQKCGDIENYQSGCVGRTLRTYPNLERKDLRKAIEAIDAIITHAQLMK